MAVGHLIIIVMFCFRSGYGEAANDGAVGVHDVIRRLSGLAGHVDGRGARAAARAPAARR